MIAAGNSVVFNVHPNAKRVSNRLVALLNDAIAGAGGPRNLLCAVAKPDHRERRRADEAPRAWRCWWSPGGPGVVKAAMASGKKAICAGPGNPPCVVDETADLVKAGRDIVAGAGFDNNVVCICEKEVLAVESIADSAEAGDADERRLRAHRQPDRGGDAPGHSVSEWSARGRARRTRTWWARTPRSSPARRESRCRRDAASCSWRWATEHPLVWSEQLMPVLPLVRMRSADEAIDFAVQVEHGFRHTAIDPFARHREALADGAAS